MKYHVGDLWGAVTARLGDAYLFSISCFVRLCVIMGRARTIVLDCMILVLALVVFFLCGLAFVILLLN